MSPSIFVNFLVALAGLGLCVASPEPFQEHQQPPLQPYDKRDTCNNRSVDTIPECWDELQITQYLENWWEQHQEECDSSPYLGGGFASCYQQKLNITDQPCSNISVASCYHPLFADNINVTEYYVLYSIMGLWTWYNTIWQAAEDSTLLADLQAGDIIDTIKSDMPHDDPLPGHTSLGALLSLLSAGLAFLSFPAGDAATQALSTAVGQAPGLAKAFLTTGTLASQVTPLDQIDNFLGSVIAQFQINIANGLNFTQSDFGAFISHAANGSFIADQGSLNTSTVGLTQYLKTYIVSQALQSHNIIITVARNLSVYDLSHKKFTEPAYGTMLPQNAWHVNCQDDPSDNRGVCDNWWVDSSTNDSYALYKLDDIEHNYYGLMNTLFANEWTTGEQLFVEANTCWGASIPEFFCVEGSAIDDLYCEFPLFSGVHFPQTDPATFLSACYSNIRVCEWNQQSNLTAEYYSPKTGNELNSNYQGSLLRPCEFAWSNMCIDGQGFSVNGTGYDFTTFDDEPLPNWGIPQLSTTYLQNSGAGAGTAIVTGYSSGDSWVNKSVGMSSLLEPELNASMVPEALLAVNSLYDLVNTPLDALQAQANSMNKEQCKEYPKDHQQPIGWGGAGYLVHDAGCDRWPASYLGPGLYFDIELCGPLP